MRNMQRMRTFAEFSKNIVEEARLILIDHDHPEILKCLGSQGGKKIAQRLTTIHGCEYKIEKHCSSIHIATLRCRL
jgi:hypothetical protein